MSSSPPLEPATAATPLAAADLALAPMSLDLAQATEALEAQLIAQALRQTADNKRRAAALLGISERTLWYKLGRSK